MSCCGNNFAEKDDLVRWIRGKRFDILRYCEGYFYIRQGLEKDIDPEHSAEFLMQKDNSGPSWRLGIGNWKMRLSSGRNRFWFDPKSGFRLAICPFLRKRHGKEEFECGIYETQPTVCREYFCRPFNMKLIVKRPFTTNYKEYRRKRKNNVWEQRYIFRPLVLF